MSDQRLDYNTQLKNLPTLLALPIDYVTGISNKPTIPVLPIDYVTGITNKPTIPTLPIDYVTGINNKPVSPFILNIDYIFVAQTPGGSLVVGANTITLNPMPLGITAASVGIHKLYISAGTGTAESVLITGWTSTTVIVACANTHSGAWTIQSASHGIQEAIIAAGTNGYVFVLSGDHNIYGTITVPGSYTNFALTGAGANQTRLINQSIATDVIYWNSTSGYVSLANFGILGTHSAGAGWGIKVLNGVFGFIANIFIQYGHDGFYLANPNSLHITNVVGYGLDHIGMQLDATNGGVAVSKFTACNFSTYGSLVSTNTDLAALYITTQTGGTIAGPTFTDCQFVGFAAAIRTLAAAGTSMNEINFTGGGITGHVYGLRVIATGATAYSWRFSDVQYIAALSNDVTVSGPAISLDEGCKRFTFSDSVVEGASPTFQTIDLQGATYVDIIACAISQLGAGSEIKIGTGAGGAVCKHVRVLSCEIGYIANTNMPTGSIGIEVSAAAHEHITLAGYSKVYGATAALSYLGTGLNNYIDLPNIDPASGSPGKPTAAAGIRDSKWHTRGGAGVADKYEICRKDAADAYAWTALY